LYNAEVPPRYAYWTILIDNIPTAFRSRDAEELLPTLNQLRRKNSDVVMKWFARGRLWDTPEQAQWAGKNLKGSEEKRGRDWRPGGEHKDPRARFDKRKEKRKQDHRQRGDTPSGVAASSKHDPIRRDKKPGGSQDQRPWQQTGSTWRDNPVSGAAKGGGRPWRDNPAPGAAKGSGRPWRDNLAPGAAKGGGRPWRDRPAPGAAKGERLWRDNPAPGAAKGGRPWRDNQPGPEYPPRERVNQAPGAGAAHRPDAQPSPKRQKGEERQIGPKR
jgi:hypothetical protein